MISFDFVPFSTYNILGGIVGDDNAIYGIPYRACGVLRIDSTTDYAEIIGPNYGIGNYYWHGGIKCNGKIYGKYFLFRLCFTLAIIVTLYLLIRHRF